MAKKVVNRQPGGGSVWNVLLSTWYSMLNSVDYLRQLTPYQVAVMDKEKIVSIGTKVRHLCADGIRLWQEEQLDALTIEQLGVLDPERTLIVATHGSPQLIRQWVKKSDVRSLSRQIGDILKGIGLVDAKLRQVGVAFNERSKTAASARLFLKVMDIVEDEAFRLIVAEITNRSLEQLIDANIREDLAGDPTFRLKIEKEFTEFIKGRTEYVQRETLYPESKKELEVFERRILSAKHRHIREQIYSELQERLSEWPFVGLPSLLLPWGHIHRLSSRRGQNEVLRELFEELKDAIDSDREVFESQYGMHWFSYEEIDKEWTDVKQQAQICQERLKKIIHQLEETEKLLRPIAAALSEGKYDSSLLEEVDGYVAQFGDTLIQFNELVSDFASVVEMGQIIASGVAHLLEQERFTEESGEAYVGALPFVLFERLITLSLYDPRGPISQKKVIQFFLKLKSLKRFQKYFELYAEVLTESQKFDQLYEQLESLQVQDEIMPRYRELEVILRCRKKVEAWDFFKTQTAPFQAEEGE